jgi:hypothetical protein
MVRERRYRGKLRAARSLGEHRVWVSARTSPRTALLTRVRAQSRRFWFHLLTIARPHPKITGAFTVSAAICLLPSPARIPLAASGGQERCELAARIGSV